MGRFWTFLYGGILIVISLAALITDLLDAYGLFLPIIVMLMGVLILYTSLETPSQPGFPVGSPTVRPHLVWFRRWFFGSYLILAGLMTIIDIYTSFPWMARTSLYTFSGQLIVLAIGAIYFLAAFERTRNIQIGSY